MPAELTKPWDAFLIEVDQALAEPIELHCLGGFAVVMLYGLRQRPTADVDILAVRPAAAAPDLIRRAGRRSPLHEKHGVYLQVVTVLGAYPEEYEQRLTDMFPGAFRRLRLLALDPYDLALTKLERNSQRDRDDVYYLADAVPLDLETLRARYLQEMRPYLGDPAREDQTLALWIEAIEERRQRA